MISVVVPAHNEGAVIGRLMRALLADAEPSEFEVIVVANGCTDDTASRAVAEAEATCPGSVRVVSTPVPSKYQALRLGDTHATAFPRLYIDADVVLGTDDARALAAALRQPGVLAAAPRRVLGLSGSALVVKWYYDYWQRLPTVRHGLYGRGVIGVSEIGQARLTALPDVMADDLAASVAFAPSERQIISDAQVVVHGPKTAADLLNRRVRALTSTAQLQQRQPDAVSGTADNEGTRTSTADLLGIVRRNPLLVGKLVVFLAFTAVARARARRPIKSQDFHTWLRDESSRTDPDGATSGGR